MNNLLPCPFCGGEAELHDGVVIIPVIDENGAYIDADVEDAPAWVECAACGATTAGVDSAGEAIAAWNRRAQPSEKPEPPTNADRIRGMTDEELAAERIEFNYNPNGADYYSGDFGHHNIFYNNGVIPPEVYQKAFKKELDWLQQPATEAP